MLHEGIQRDTTTSACGYVACRMTGVQVSALIVGCYVAAWLVCS